MSKTIIFWDFDGVMADSTPFVFNYWREAFADQGVIFTREDYSKTFDHKFPFEYLTETYGDMALQIKEDYSAYETAHYPAEVEFFDGIKPVIQYADQHFRNVIISSNLAVVIKPCLERQGLDHVFEYVVGRETPGYKDEKIRAFCQKEGLEPSDGYFIGDTISDMEHAHKVGTRSIAVTWGVHNRARLETCQPDVIVDDVEALFNCLI